MKYPIKKFAFSLLIFSSILLSTSSVLANTIDNPNQPLNTVFITRCYLLYVLLPIWLIAGIIDYIFHRRSNIETTSGTHESLIHIIMMTETGIPILMGLFLDINSLVLLIMILAFFMHEITAMWDVAYTLPRRKVVSFEQHVHSFLEILPFTAVSFIACLHWQQLLAIVGLSGQPARYILQFKNPPLSIEYITGILISVTLFLVLPYTEEFIRCFCRDHTVKARPVHVHDSNLQRNNP